jgi:hypothetical protein
MNGDRFSRPAAGERSRLRLVQPSQRPRRLEVRVNATEARYPYGRSRVFRLAPDDLDELIAAATRMERRG